MVDRGMIAHGQPVVAPAVRGNGDR
jgi:hypothetical protein